MNIKSNEINIYPTSSRSPIIDYGANLNLEQNITALLTNITDYDSYIVTGLELDTTTIDTNTYACIKVQSDNTYGKCVLKGYEIKLTPSTTPTSPLVITTSLNTSSNYVVYMKLTGFSERTINGYNIKILNGIDQNDEYTGVELGVTAYTGAYSDSILNDGELKLGTLEYDTNEWVITNSAKNVKFNANTIQVQLQKESGLVNINTYKGSLKDLFEKNFIVDDGEI